jgi:hypothetical protein
VRATVRSRFVSAKVARRAGSYSAPTEISICQINELSPRGRGLTINADSLQLAEKCPSTALPAPLLLALSVLEG